MLNELKVSVTQRLLKLDKGSWLVTGDKLKKDYASFHNSLGKS